MENIDYILDLLNDVRNFQEKSTEDDHLFMLLYNKKHRTLTRAFFGDLEELGSAVSAEDKLLVLKSEHDKEVHRHMKFQIMHMALNVLMSEQPEVREHFIDSLIEYDKELNEL